MADDPNTPRGPNLVASDSSGGVNPNALTFEKLLQIVSLGMSPQAPRLPEQNLTSAAYFGGYQKGFSNRMGFRGTMNFSTLRQIAERSSLLSAILATRLHQVARFARVASRSIKGEVGFRVVHKRSAEKGFKVPEQFDAMCRDVERMISVPWKVYWDEGMVYKEIEPNMAGFLQKITEDLLVINRPVIELGLDPMRVPRAFGAIDGANIIPTFAAIRYLSTLNRDMPKDYAENYASYKRLLGMVAERYRLNLDERTEYIYMLQGKPTAAFRADELIVAPTMPCTDVMKAGYPKSMTERAIFTILAEILAMTANQRYFEFGNMMEVILGIKGNWDDKHVKDFQDVIQGNMSGIPGMYRVPMVALPNGKDDLVVTPVKQNQKDMLFDIYIQKLTNLACAVFRMHPSEINEAPRAGDNNAVLGQASQETQISMAQEQGLEGALMHTKQTIYDPILERINPDMCLEWEYGKNEANAINVTMSKGPILTVDEMRAELNYDPLPNAEEGSAINNPAILQAKQLEAQQKQAETQAASAQQPGAGAPPGGAQEAPPKEDDGGGDDKQGEDEDEGDDNGHQAFDENDQEFSKRIAKQQQPAKGKAPSGPKRQKSASR